MRNKENQKAYNKIYWEKFGFRYRKEASLRSIQWQRNNREIHNARVRAWRKRNKYRIAAWAASRRALKTMAMPPWVNRLEIAKIYLEAQRLSLLKGKPYHVDHIWPLNGDGFTGLHVPWNLRVIEGLENQRKWKHRPK